MKLHDLHNTPGSRKKRKIVGRGDGSGLGGTAGRGHKGQKARSGANMRPFFEGGQIPFFRRLPKRGFKSLDHKHLNTVNVSILETSFSAGARLMNRKPPVASDWTVFLSFVPILVNVSFAWATAAPEVSVTVPTMLP